MPQLAPLAITMGDPAGIGPEIIASAIAAMAQQLEALRAEGRGGAVVIGDSGVMARAAEITGVDLTVREVSTIHEVKAEAYVLHVMPASPPLGEYRMGVVDQRCGKVAFEAVVAAISLARSGAVRGIVTAPIHKRSLSLAGISYPGHTEILAAYGGAQRVAMMLVNDEIRTVLVSIHCSMREALGRVTHENILAAIGFAETGCRALGIEHPRVAVAGLNPHAGEGGLFGREEIAIIMPAIAESRRSGIEVSGPWPADTVFLQARQGEFDVVVAQYHDQGLIPLKYMGLDKGVNITLGLPFVRTSPDHGTAFDIAGKGLADPASFVRAIDYAERLRSST